MYGLDLSTPDDIARKWSHYQYTSDAGVTAFAGLGIYSGSRYSEHVKSPSVRNCINESGDLYPAGNVETPLLATSDPEALKCTESLVGESFGASRYWTCCCLRRNATRMVYAKQYHGGTRNLRRRSSLLDRV